ncbi:MAG: BamA/TamA family outer membrane protein, partial [Muribaculaceae bacterium]|nr:BamA/TamA family outer membrane protein [Muribaculaceae bacterium]
MNFRKSYSLLAVIIILIQLVLLNACSSTRHVPDGEYLLDKVKINIDEKDKNDLKSEDFISFLRQQPNHKMLWSAKLRLGIYNMSGSDTTKWWNKWIRKIGEPPVIFQSKLMNSSIDQLTQALINKGYIDASVSADTISNNGKKISVNYTLHPGTPHVIKNFYFQINDSVISTILASDTAQIQETYTGLLDRNKLDELRTRITQRLRNGGYYNFVKENITFEADTTENSNDVDLTMIVHQADNGAGNFSRPNAKKYLIRKVFCIADYNGSNDFLNEDWRSTTDTVEYKGMTILYGDDRYLKPNVIFENNFIVPGREYSERVIDRTYKAFSRLEILKFINIRFEPAGSLGELGLLDAYILLTPGKSMSMSADLEGTNSEGDLGLALGLSFSHRNIGKGSESFTAKARGAYEAIHGNLEGLLHNRYMEYSLDLGLQFPKFKAPFLRERFKRRINASTEFHLSMNYQQRPEYTRIVSTIGWGYNWTERYTGNRHTFTPIDINYVYLPESTNDFINNISPDNPLLRYSYEDHFIMRMGYSFYHTNKRANTPWNYLQQRDIYTIRLNAECAGNLLFLINSVFTHRSNFHVQPYKIFGIHYSQYVKFDSNFAYTHIFDERQSIAARFGLGIGIPYGNSGMLPFEKRFYGGGANGVRGWAVRTLGPGAYRGVNQIADYMNQCGDIRCILSAEYRAKLFWIIELGMFVDVGNIFTIRNYPAQPEGFFRFDSFYNQLAAAYGLGVRLDFDYFLLRFDLGMKAHNPAKCEEPWPLIHPKWGRDRAFHFSIG